MKQKQRVVLGSALLGLWLAACGGSGSGGDGGPGGTYGTSSGILFVGQVPVGSFNNVTDPFGNQGGDPISAPRGGGLFLRTPDGKVRNLTQEAGFGDAGAQGMNGIAVRQPTVHWDGDKAVFSMVIGGPAKQYDTPGPFFWQIYEVSGLSKAATGGAIAIRKVMNQPDSFNNIAPFYSSDDKILFTSDRPRDGLMHHYPQLDEYESDATVIGIYSLDESSGTLTLLEHTPSGLFYPIVDSFGRIIFTRWDHLQRDQQGDNTMDANEYMAFTYASEDANATMNNSIAGNEVFPEPRTMDDPGYDGTYAPHTFNVFLPWMLNQDGTNEETVNHLGRHELGGPYTNGNFQDDPALQADPPSGLRANTNFLSANEGLFQIKEDPKNAGRYYSTNSPEFTTANAGYIQRFDGGPDVNPVDMQLINVTPAFDKDGNPVNGAGYFRDPVPMSDGSLIASHTDGTDVIKNMGSEDAPNWSYNFRLQALDDKGDHFEAGAMLTDGINVDLTWWTPDVMAHYSGPLWELNPVEVVSRPRPPMPEPMLAMQEQSVFDGLGLDPGKLKDWMKQNSLALVVSRNVTQRDKADQEQPFNLRVTGGVVSDTGHGKMYDITHIQFMQADQLRGYGPMNQPKPGRRVLARPMHDPNTSGGDGGIPGAVALGMDGSMAAFVPAQRAMAWQLVNGGNAAQPIVRERNWVSFQSGEIRVCTACHGINKMTQTDMPQPMNSPQALHDLLQTWMSQHP